MPWTEREEAREEPLGMNETSGLCKQARAASAEQAGQCQGVPGVRGAPCRSRGADFFYGAGDSPGASSTRRTRPSFDANGVTRRAWTPFIGRFPVAPLEIVTHRATRKSQSPSADKPISALDQRSMSNRVGATRTQWTYRFLRDKRSLFKKARLLSRRIARFTRIVDSVLDTLARAAWVQVGEKERRGNGNIKYTCCLDVA